MKFYKIQKKLIYKRGENMEPEEKKTKRTTREKGANTAKKTTKKFEATAKTPSTKKAPAKKKTVSKVKKEEIVEEIKTNDNILKKQEAKKEIKEENNQREEKKKNKKYIEISLGAVVCAIIIIALIVLNVKLAKHAYGLLKNESTNSNVQSENNISVTQEIGNVLKKTDDIVKQMKDKITYSSNVTASIYNSQGFNTNTISNELKLILGWANTDDGKKLKSRNEKDEEVEAIEKEVMSETIQSTLGPNIKYVDESFNYTKISLFENSSRSKGIINFGEGVYTSILENEQGEASPLIYQEIQKVVKYSEKVIVYVKAAFIDSYEDTYQIYKSFENNNFSYELLQIKQNELFNNTTFDKYTGEGSVTIEENRALDSIRKQLNTYKYTFTFDETMQEYYLSEFGRENS